MTIKEAKEDLKTLRNYFEKQSEGTFPGVLQYCFYLLSAIEKNDKELMTKLIKGEIE